MKDNNLLYVTNDENIRVYSTDTLQLLNTIKIEFIVYMIKKIS
jgi:hypothetical protein